MAKLLRKKNIFPDLILCSTAVRASEFAIVISKELECKKKQVVFTDRLYMADEDEMLELIRTVDDSNETVFMIGHNPSLTGFANLIADYRVPNIPTSGIYSAVLEIRQWKQIDFGTGKFDSFEYPKKYYY